MAEFEKCQSQNQESSMIRPAKPDLEKTRPTYDKNLIPGNRYVLGNQAVQRLLKSQMVQAKLEISDPNDKYEQEADRVADQVMSMPEPRIQHKSTCPECNEEENELLQTKPIADQITPIVQRQLDEDEEEPIQAKLDDSISIQRQIEPEEEEETLQEKQTNSQEPAVTPNLESRINALKGSGQSLPEPVRSYFEPRFEADFSHVRIHTDSKAANIAYSMNAKALTFGNNVFFGRDQYTLDKLAGQKLIAHELTHVLQQKNLHQCVQMQSKPKTRFKSYTKNFNSACHWDNYLLLTFENEMDANQVFEFLFGVEVRSEAYFKLYKKYKDFINIKIKRIDEKYGKEWKIFPYNIVAKHINKNTRSLLGTINTCRTSKTDIERASETRIYSVPGKGNMTLVELEDFLCTGANSLLAGGRAGIDRCKLYAAHESQEQLQPVENRFRKSEAVLVPVSFSDSNVWRGTNILEPEYVELETGTVIGPITFLGKDDTYFVFKRLLFNLWVVIGYPEITCAKEIGFIASENNDVDKMLRDRKKTRRQ